MGELMNSITKMSFITLVAVSAGLAQAGDNGTLVTATVTADNHYAIYNVTTGSNIGYVAQNEEGLFGNPGTYNWSLPETNTFTTNNVFYIAAWSDDSVAQGLLGQFSFNNSSLLTGQAGIDVFRTGISLNTDDPRPSTASVTSQVALANGTNGWRTPSVYLPNLASTAPWGQIPGITEDANWIWADSRNGENVFFPGGDFNEYLLFRITIPSPGALALLGLGGLIASRRKR
jgi:hypothetical protein